MTPDEEIVRGNQAKAMLNSPIYKEAWEAPEARIVQLLRSADLDPAKRERLNYLLIAFAAARSYAEQVMFTGKMAAQQIERDRTFTERMVDRVRSVA